MTNINNLNNNSSNSNNNNNNNNNSNNNNNNNNSNNNNNNSNNNNNNNNNNIRSSSPPPLKKKKINPKDDLVLPDGWTTHTTTRKNGKSAGRVVPHWISPEGKKFRSKAAIKEYLAKINPSLSLSLSDPPSSSSSHSVSTSSIAPSSSSSISNSSEFSPHLSHHSHSSHHFPSSLSLSGGELPSSVLTPLGEDDKIFGMNLHHRDDDDDSLLSTPNTNNPLAGSVSTCFTGVLPQLQMVGTCRVSGHLDGLGLITQITIGEKTYRGIVLNEEYSSLSPSSSPSSAFPPMEHFAEMEKHVQACQDIIYDDVAMRYKVMGADVSSMLHKTFHPLITHNNNINNNHNNNNNNNSSHHLHHHSSNSSMMHPPPSHLSSLHSANGHHNSFNDLDLDDEDEDDRRMIGLGLNGHLSSNLNHHHHSHHSHLSSSHHHPLSHTLSHHSSLINHRMRETGSNSSTDTEEGLGGYDLKTETSLSYDSFHNSPGDPDSFLNTKLTNSNNNLNINNSNTDTIDGLDIIADDMPQEIDMAKQHTQDAPIIHKQHNINMGGLLNSHMLISPRHLMNV